jgi:hypothetical protein
MMSLNFSVPKIRPVQICLRTIMANNFDYISVFYGKDILE